MKKLLYTIGILMFASVMFQPFGALGQSDSQYSSKEPAVSKNRFFSDILPDFASENVFEGFGETDIDDVGVDLYAKILASTVVEPENSTTKKVAEKYGLTTAELDAIRSGSYLPLVERKPTLSQSELFLKVTEINRKFNEERDLASLDASIKAETMPSEIFMNGELGDSGFDLLYDLTMIEKLLFLKTSEYTIGADYNGSGGASGSSAVGAGGAGGAGGSVGDTAGIGASVSGGGKVISGGVVVGKSGVSGSGGSALGSASAPVGGSTPAGASVPGPIGSDSSTLGESSSTEASDVSIGEQPVKGQTFNPELCFADTGIKGLVNAFAQQNGLDAPGFTGDGRGSLLISANPVNTGFGLQEGDLSNSGSAQTVPPDDESAVPSNVTGGSDGGSSGGSSGALNPAGSSDADFLPANEPAPTKAVSAPRDNWKKEKICDDVFCLFVDFYNDPPDSQYQDTDNCLACHVEKINDALRETLNSSLMPNKMTGNLIEVPKCKSGMAASLTSLSINLSVQFMPILTPLNDELILSSDSGVDWREYCEATAFLPTGTCKEEKTPEDFEEEPENPDERIAQKELEMNSEASALEIAERISDAKLILEQEANEALEELNAKRDSNANVMLFNSIKQEMDRMKLYFVNYRNIFRSLHEEVPGMVGIQACTELKNKKVCK